MPQAQVAQAPQSWQGGTQQVNSPFQSIVPMPKRSQESLLKFGSDSKAVTVVWPQIYPHPACRHSLLSLQCPHSNTYFWFRWCSPHVGGSGSDFLGLQGGREKSL